MFVAAYTSGRIVKMNSEPSPPLEIPQDALTPDALAGIVDEFIQREGTDYGAVELSHGAKVERIRKQMRRGDIKIVFDPNTESVTLMTVREFERQTGGSR